MSMSQGRPKFSGCRLPQPDTHTVIAPNGRRPKLLPEIDAPELLCESMQSTLKVLFDHRHSQGGALGARAPQGGEKNCWM